MKKMFFESVDMMVELAGSDAQENWDEGDDV